MFCGKGSEASRGICSPDWRCCITLRNVQRGRSLHRKMVIKYIFAKKTGNVSVQKRKEEEKKKAVPLVQFSHLVKQSERDISPHPAQTEDLNPSTAPRGSSFRPGARRGALGARDALPALRAPAGEALAPSRAA